MSSADQEDRAGVFFREARPGLAGQLLILATANLLIILLYEVAASVTSVGGEGWWATASSLLVAAAGGAAAGCLVVAFRGGAVVLLALALLLVLEAAWSAGGFSQVGSGYASWVASPAPESRWEWRWSGMVCALSVAVAGRWCLQRGTQ